MSLEIGAAKVDITPQAPVRLAGYGARDHESEGVHDRLALRALFARGAGGSAAVLLSADIIWFGEGADGIRSGIGSGLGVAPECVVMAGTHTHSAPGTRGEGASRAWLEALEAAAIEAAARAQERAAPVSLSLARGETRIGVNRREMRPDGSIVLGSNPEGPVDREVIVVSADDPDGRRVARIVNAACHGVVLGPGNYLVSGDWPGAAAALLEERLGCPVLYLNGGAGNVDPRARVQIDFGPVAEIAAEFVRDLTAACEHPEVLPEGDGIAGGQLAVELPRKLRDFEEGRGRTRRVLLRGLKIGPVSLVGYPGEMFCQTAMAVKAQAPDPCTLVSAYLDDGSAGYIPVREAYETGGYEVGSSPYSPDGEEVLREALLKLLRMP